MTLTASNANELLCDNNTVKTHHDNRSSWFFLLNIVYFSVCLTSNKLYWIKDQLADVSTRFYTSASWSVGELTVIQFRWVHFTFLVYFCFWIVFLYLAYYWMNNISYLKQEALKHVRKHNVACFFVSFLV